MKVWGLSKQNNEIALFVSLCSREEQAESRASDIKCDTCLVFDVGAYGKLLFPKSSYSVSMEISVLLFVVPGVALNLRHGIFKSRKEKLRDEDQKRQ